MCFWGVCLIFFYKFLLCLDGMRCSPIEMKNFEPYGEMLSQLTVTLQQDKNCTTSLPSKIPEVFPGLMELEFIGADLLEELPDNLSQISDLQTLSIR